MSKETYWSLYLKKKLLDEFLAMCGDLDARDKVAELLEMAYTEGWADGYCEGDNVGYDRGFDDGITT